MRISQIAVISSVAIACSVISLTSFANVKCSQQPSEKYFKCDVGRIAAIQSVDAIVKSADNVTKNNGKQAKSYRFDGNELILS